MISETETNGLFWVYCIVISIFSGISVTGLVYTLLKALSSGAKEYTGEYSISTAKQFEDIFLFIPAKRIAEIGWISALVLFIVVFLLVGNIYSLEGLFLGFFLGSIAGIIGLNLPKFILKFLKKRRLEKFNLQLVDALLSMSNALKAGFSIMQAFESVVQTGENPIAQEFELFLQQTRIGINFSDALKNLEKRVGSEDLSLMINAIETARKTGGSLTEVFESISATIRERIRIENRIRTLTAQGRLQGIVVGCMPAVILIALFIVRPGMLYQFTHSIVGISTICIVALLVFLGALWIRKIINIDI